MLQIERENRGFVSSLLLHILDETLGIPVLRTPFEIAKDHTSSTDEQKGSYHRSNLKPMTSV
jgi:hypothetical protein